MRVHASLADRLWPLFEQRLFSVPSTPALFNQYSDEDPALDRPGGAATRRDNLRAYLQHCSGTPELLLVGEAVGYRGARFSGVPFTSERLLTGGRLPYQGQQSSLGRPYAEPTATLVWGQLLRYPGAACAWNAVPLHARKPGQPLSNRTPSAAEVERFAPLLQAVYEAAAPGRVVALGRKAEASLTMLGIAHAYVRHPASGGAAAFRNQLPRVLMLY